MTLQKDLAPVITVDGPGGSGKGTVCHLVAKRLGWHLLDSGALYRVLAWQAHLKGADLEDEQALELLAQKLDVAFATDQEGLETRVILEGVECTHQIRTDNCGRMASAISAFPRVRFALVDRQRGFAQAPGLVTDGRDMGTVIFPEAKLKIFLTASAEERAARRYKQLQESRINASLAALTESIRARDEQDMRRTVSPLRPAEDAITIDSTTLSIGTVVDLILKAASDRGVTPSLSAAD